MPRNSSVIGSIIGLIVFLGLGVFFLFGFGSFHFFSFVPFFPMFFVCIIIGIAGAASAGSRHSTCCPSRPQNQYQQYTQQVPRSNPYLVKSSSSSTVRQIPIEDDKPEHPVTNFCQYCGTKRDRNANYCHNCGTKLQ
jgi:hypothetical protein